MKSKIDITLIISSVVCLAPILLFLAMYDSLPEQVAIHWDASGTADNFAPKAFVTFGLPVLMAALNCILHVQLKNDPKKANVSKVLKVLLKWVIPAMSIVVMPITLFIAMGVNIPIQTVIPALVGLLIAVCGNYLPKCRYNYTVGIRVPWTLASEENWNKTHHMAGYIWTLGGILMIINSFLALWLLSLIVMILLIVIPYIYSYALYKKSPNT